MSLPKSQGFDFERLKKLGDARWNDCTAEDDEAPETEVVFDVNVGSVNVNFARTPEQKSERFETVHFIVAHSKEHFSWAQSLERQLTESVNSIFPSILLSHQFLPIEGTEEDVRETLAQCYLDYEPMKAQQTFIVTLGWQESQMVGAANKKNALPYPQLFCVPGSPGKLLHVAGSEGDTKLVGGVFSTPPSAKLYLSSILGFKPETKAVVLAYDPNPASEELKKYILTQVIEIEEAFAKKGVRVIRHYWTPENGNIKMLSSALTSADSIIILNEPAAEAHRGKLIRMCNLLHKFICASELDSVLAGAALGGGVPGSAFGVPLASLITNYLLMARNRTIEKLGWSTYQIPEQSGMRFNEWAFGVQGIELSDEKEAILRMKSAFDSSCVEY